MSRVESANRLKISQSQQRVSLLNLMTQKSSPKAPLAMTVSQSNKGMPVVPLEAVAVSSDKSRPQMDKEKLTTPE